MEETSRKSTYFPPMRLAEMMPNLFGTMPQSAKLTSRKAERARPHTTGKSIPPNTILNMAQLRAVLKVNQSPKRGRAPPSSMKKKWNTSTKCENKRMSLTANTRSKQLTARKILDFKPPPPKAMVSNLPRPSIKHTFLSPKNVNKVLKNHKDKNLIRISGICDISETPATNKLSGSHRIVWNKENVSSNANVGQTSFIKPQSDLDDSFRNLIGNRQRKSTSSTDHSLKIDKKSGANQVSKTLFNVPDIKIQKSQNRGEKNTCIMPKETSQRFRRPQYGKKLSPVEPSPTDSQENSELSFLEREKVIYNETVLRPYEANEDSPRMSTPFKQYRKVEEFCNESSDFENTCNDITAINYDKASFLKINDGKEESDILSLCDLMEKAKVTHTEKTTQGYEDELLKIKAELEVEARRLKGQKRFVIMSMKRNELMLRSINKLLQPESINDPTSVVIDPYKQLTTEPQKVDSSESSSTLNNINNQKSCNTFIRRTSNSPSYKIPKHSPCMRKKLLYKSVPLGLDKINPATPIGRPTPGKTAMTMYLKMKEQCQFLMTPVRNKPLQAGNVTNTPAITSMNLQSQLEKLYNETP